jgi:hypothetical protein
VAIATFAHQARAQAAVDALGKGGLDISHLGVAGRGCHVDACVSGYYNRVDRIRKWSGHGMVCGGLWGLMLGVMVMAAPARAAMVLSRYAGALALATLEGALAAGLIGALVAALYGLGIARDSVPRYTAAITADRILVMVQVVPDQIALARSLLDRAGALRVDVHEVSMSNRIAPANAQAPENA